MALNANEEESNVIDMDKLYKLYVDHYPLTYEVTDKLSEDHQLAAANISKQTSINAAIERYTRNQNILLSSWFLLSEDNLINKAKSADKKARVYNGNQQLTAKIKVTRRTVTLSVIDRKAALNSKKELKQVLIEGEKHYLDCTSEEKTLDIQIVGPWNPLTGDFKLYHYQEGALPLAHDMLARYNVWIRDKTTKEYIRPLTKT